MTRAISDETNSFATRGYCYGRQVMYVDKYSFNILWKDIYDTSMNLWKIDMIEHIASEVAGEGIQFETSNWV